MRTDITPGQTSDYLGFDLGMHDNLPEPRVLLADRGYDADRIRKTMSERDILAQIPLSGHCYAMPCRAKDAQNPQDAGRCGSRALSIKEHGRVLLQQAQKRPPGRHTIRQNRRKLPWVHRHHVNPALGPPFVNRT